MTWKSEAKKIKQNYYGGYVSMSKQLNITPITYCYFNEEEYQKIRDKYKQYKKSIRIP